MTSMAADEAPAAVAAVTSAGAALRSAREARGLHIAALAAMLKVPQAKLEALEADRHQDLPDATFARALARAVCRALKIESEPVLALLPRGNEATLDRVSPGLNQPFRERALSQDGLSLEVFKSPVVLAAAGLLLAALLVYLLPSHWTEGLSQRLGGAEATGVVSPGEAASAVELAPAAAVDPSASSEAAGAVAPMAASASAMPASASVPAPTALQGAPAAPATASASAAAPLAPVAGGAPLQVKVSSESWVEVVDAQGQVLLSRLLRPGEQASLSGQAPLKLRIGNVAGTELVFRGQPVDLASRSRDNVARLELN